MKIKIQVRENLNTSSMCSLASVVGRRPITALSVEDHAILADELTPFFKNYGNNPGLPIT